MTTVGYVWVSTVDHSLDIQLDAFNAADCTHVFTDTASAPLTHAPAPPLPSTPPASPSWRLPRRSGQ